MKQEKEIEFDLMEFAKRVQAPKEELAVIAPSLIFLSLGTLGMLLAEIYFLLQYGNDLVVVVGGGGILLFLSCFLIQAISKRNLQKEKARMAYIENLLQGQQLHTLNNSQNTQGLEEILKFQKALYVQLKHQEENTQKGLEKLEQTLHTCFEHLEEFSKEEGRKELKLNIKYQRDDARRMIEFQEKAFTNILTGMEQCVETISSIKISALQTGNGDRVDTCKDDTEKEELPAVEIEDPNKMMSPEDIAALLAAQEEPKEEKEELPTVEIEDPNKMMSPEDIAALLAAQEEPKEEKEELPTVEIEDPNKMMSPEDIAALLAAQEG